MFEHPIWVSLGLLPIIHHLEYGGRVLKPLDLYEILTGASENVVIEASVNGKYLLGTNEIYS